MSSANSAVSEPHDSAQAWDAAGDGCAAPLAERRMRMLDRLAEPVAELNAAALAYARVSRAVRLTLMLQARLIEDLGASEASGAAEAREIDRRSDPVYRRKARVEAIVERVAEAQHPGDDDTVDDLVRESAERLDDEDLYGDLMERPVSELVARLCQDLGLDPDWGELAQELWAVREIESGDVGWPLERRAQARPLPSAESEQALLRRSLEQLEAAERGLGIDTG